MLRRLPIRTKLLLMVGVPVLVLVAATAIGLRTFQETRVGGPRYDDVISAKDLVADVLPPPEYIIEAYLSVVQLASNPSVTGSAKSIDDLARLEREYLNRHTYWDANLENAGLRAALLTDVHEPAARLFSMVNNQFLPALRAENTEVVRALAFGEMKTVFEEHRAAVVKLVGLAEAEQDRVEKSTDAIINRTLLLLLVGVALGAAATVLVGSIVARSIIRPIHQLRKAAMEDLPRTVEAIRNTDLEAHEVPELRPVEIDSGDELAEAASAFNAVVSTAIGLASAQVRLRQHTSEMFINLGHRNQTFIDRQHELIDTIQSEVVDPDMLAGLFELDHTVTRMRRNAESLLVLAGTTRRRTWSAPVPMSDVIGAAVSEVAEMRRVDVTLDASGDRFIEGVHAFDVSHLVAELIENATLYSSPTTRVDVRVQRSRNLTRVWVIDNGIGMSETELAEANRQVSDLPTVEEVSADQVGFQVVARLSRRLGIEVRLQDNPAGGLAVSVDLPPELLTSAPISIPSEPSPAPITGAGRASLAARPAPINVDDFVPDPTPLASSQVTPADEPTRSASLPRRSPDRERPAEPDGPRFDLFSGARSTTKAEGTASSVTQFTESVERGRADASAPVSAPAEDGGTDQRGDP